MNAHPFPASGRLPLAALLLLVLAGCASTGPPQARRAPAPEPAPAPAPPPPSGVEVRPYRPPPPPPPAARPAPARAVQALLARARDQQAAGDLAGAAATLERALRIDPRNALLWNRLARVRLAQGRHRQAAGLAAKSNALAGGDAALRADNARILERARSRP